MKTFLSLILITFSLSVSAEENACGALIAELGIKPNQGEVTMRKVTLEGKTNDDKECQVKFLPDYCTFELEAPLESAEMYYLQATSTSTVKIIFNTNNRFSFKAVTKETTDDWGQVTKVLKIDRADKGSYELKYEMKEGRFFKNDAKSFKCTVSVLPHS